VGEVEEREAARRRYCFARASHADDGRHHPTSTTSRQEGIDMSFVDQCRDDAKKASGISASDWPLPTLLRIAPAKLFIQQD
jgi:hypothetical protein